MNVAETRREATVACPPGMLFVAGGTFRMGSDDHYKEEAPAHRVKVDGFFIDRTPVTNRQFKAFVKATGYVTVASGCLMRSDRFSAIAGIRAKFKLQQVHSSPRNGEGDGPTGPSEALPCRSIGGFDDGEEFGRVFALLA